MTAIPPATYRRLAAGVLLAVVAVGLLLAGARPAAAVLLAVASGLVFGAARTAGEPPADPGAPAPAPAATIMDETRPLGRGPDWAAGPGAVQ